jgi:hypothetical protein
MTPKKFRLIIALYLAIVVLAIVGHVVGAPKMPSPLREYVAAADKTTWMVGWLGITYLVIATISCIGLLLFKSRARMLFVVAMLIGVMPWDGPTVYPAMEYLFINLEFVLAGVIIALSYWSPVRERFVAKP